MRDTINIDKSIDAQIEKSERTIARIREALTLVGVAAFSMFLFHVGTMRDRNIERVETQNATSISKFSNEQKNQLKLISSFVESQNLDAEKKGKMFKTAIDCLEAGFRIKDVSKSNKGKMIINCSTSPGSP